MMKNDKKSTAYIIALTLFVFALIGMMPQASATAFGDPAARGGSSQGKGAGDLAPVDADIAAGQITIGATAQVVVLFRNDSGRPITMGAISFIRLLRCQVMCH